MDRWLLLSYFFINSFSKSCPAIGASIHSLHVQSTRPRTIDIRYEAIWSNFGSCLRPDVNSQLEPAGKEPGWIRAWKPKFVPLQVLVQVFVAEAIWTNSSKCIGPFKQPAWTTKPKRHWYFFFLTKRGKSSDNSTTTMKYSNFHVQRQKYQTSWMTSINTDPWT